VSVTLCCVSGGDPSRLAALLELCRDAVDEIVVALDDRVEEAPLADRVIRIPYEAPFERTTAWLYSQCRGEWILRLDDDEVPSPALLGSLRDVMTVDVTHVWLPRRWLYPAADAFLDEHPWVPDFQLRLSVNDPRLVRFPGVTHVPLEVDGPALYSDAPIYHLDLLRPQDERERKADAYEDARPGLRLAGRALNHALYLPPDGARTSPVPADDLAAVERVMSGSSSRGSVTSDATRAEIDAQWSLAPVDADVELELVHAPVRLEEGEQAQAVLRVSNRGSTALATPGVHVGTWWDGAAGPWSPLPVRVDAGGERLVVAALRAPAAGSRSVDIQLVHETAGRFGPVVTVPVEITALRRVGIYGADAELARAVTDHDPQLQPILLGDAVQRSIGEGIRPGRRRIRSFVTAWRRARRVPPLEVDALLIPSLEASTLVERWAQLAAVRAMRGGRVVVGAPPPPRGRLDGLLLGRILETPNVAVGDLDAL
jgi:hypothetical protein